MEKSGSFTIFWVVFCPVVLFYLAFKWMILLAAINSNFGFLLLTVHFTPFLAILLFTCCHKKIANIISIISSILIMLPYLIIYSYLQNKLKKSANISQRTIFDFVFEGVAYGLDQAKFDWVSWTLVLMKCLGVIENPKEMYDHCWYICIFLAILIVLSILLVCKLLGCFRSVCCLFCPCLSCITCFCCVKDYKTAENTDNDCNNTTIHVHHVEMKLLDTES